MSEPIDGAEMYEMDNINPMEETFDDVVGDANKYVEDMVQHLGVMQEQ